MRNAFDIAKLHSEALEKSFLVLLGQRFLVQMYSYLIEKEIVFTLRSNEGSLLGFVAASCSTHNLMKRFLFSRPLILLNLASSIFRQPKLMKSIVETALISSKLKLKNSRTESIDLPEVEILAIAVDPSAQHQGVGSRLIEALEAQFNLRGIRRYKVIAGDRLFGANRFYEKSGFYMVGQITVHGNDVSNIYTKEISN
ncbi:GNAT family N-acetyltransferase [Akkermansiaceae bacterium]|nr:GNAT family N-acetyltransferase [Akkermansiaceae bacterium]MDB4600496.1 GNAT family N-acetyltransferase [Akkermansiaceae bacterium]